MIMKTPVSYKTINCITELVWTLSTRFKPISTALMILILAQYLAGCSTSDLNSAPVELRNQTGSNGLLVPAAVIARYVDALGGQEKIRALKSTLSRGKFSMTVFGQTLEGELTHYAAAPNKSATNIELVGFGSIKSGYNGIVGWSIDPPSGPRLLQGGELWQSKLQADYYKALNYQLTYPIQENRRITQFDDVEVYELRLLDLQDNESFHYFSLDTALLVGTVNQQITPMGELEITTFIGDYVEYNGIKVPTSTVMQMPGADMEQLISEIVFDGVDDLSFQQPSSILALGK